MKKILILSLLSVTLLVACDEEASTENKTNTQETQTTVVQKTESNSDVDFKTIITDNLREGDEVTHFSNESDVIQATIKLANNDLTEEKLLAESSYSTISEKLLTMEDWNTLTINFENVGEISFNRNEAKENEYGAYFENEEIINRLSQK